MPSSRPAEPRVSGGYELVEGAIDVHCHASPDFFKRPFDVVELARDARRIGMRAIVVKNHILPTAGVAEIVSKHIDDGCRVFGSITLNHTVGGLNPQAVYAAAQHGVKEVKMPTMHSENHLRQNKGAAWNSALFEVADEKRADTVRHVARGLRILDDAGKLLPVIHEIFDVVKAEDLILATGHISVEETMVLVREARQAGVRKIVINHVENYNTRVPVAQQKELAAQGALLEHCFNSCMPIYYKDGKNDPEHIAFNVNEVGAEHSVLATDFGQPYNPAPADGLRFFAETMVRSGLARADVVRMIRDNPAALLGLD
jgi:hypothetical protein